MSDKPIAVGDLVYVAHSCCGMRVKPYMFVVAKIDDGLLHAHHACRDCLREMPKELGAVPNNGWGQPISWLKRIEPDCLNDDVPERERLTA